MRGRALRRAVACQVEQAHLYDGACRGRMECGCFHCLTVFAAAEVIDWVDDGNTPLCPYCGSDAVVDETDLMQLLRLHGQRFGGAGPEGR